MKFAISILSVFSISLTFHSILSSANESFDSFGHTEDASLLQLEKAIHAQYEIMDIYKRQELLEALEVFVEDLDNAEPTENGYRIHLRPKSAEVLDGINISAAAGSMASIAPTRATSIPKVPASPARPANPAGEVSTSRTPPNNYKWSTVLSEGSSRRTTNGRLLDIIDRGHETSRLNIRSVNRSGTRIVIGHSESGFTLFSRRLRELKRENLFLSFRRDGNTVDVYNCRSTKKLPTRWFSGFFRGSCGRATTLRTSQADDLESLVKKVNRYDIPDTFTGRVRTLRKGIFGGGFFWRWVKRSILLGVPFAVIGTAAWLSYADDEQIDGIAEVSEESWEILKYVGGGMKNFMTGMLSNETVDNMIKNRSW